MRDTDADFLMLDRPPCTTLRILKISGGGRRPALTMAQEKLYEQQKWDTSLMYDLIPSADSSKIRRSSPYAAPIFTPRLYYSLAEGLTPDSHTFQLPYNMLMSKSAREALGISLKEYVVLALSTPVLS